MVVSTCTFKICFCLFYGTLQKGRKRKGATQELGNQRKKVCSDLFDLKMFVMVQH